jgi:hypothetical protein
MWETNLPLRGHRDDFQHIEDNNINSGKFQALINFRVDSGDENIEDKL